MKSRRRRIKALALAACQTLDDFLSTPPRQPDVPLGGNGANAVLIVTDAPIGAPLKKEIISGLDEEFAGGGSYTVRVKRS